jgi:hypothetical protein
MLDVAALPLSPNDESRLDPADMTLRISNTQPAFAIVVGLLAKHGKGSPIRYAEPGVADEGAVPKKCAASAGIANVCVE